MKQLFTLVVLLSLGLALHAQSGSAGLVAWNYSSKKTGEGVYEIHLTANIGAKYHLYAQQVGVEGPVATAFTFGKNPLIALQGKVKEIGKKKSVHEEVWGGKVNFYENKVDFVQVVKLKGKIKTSLTGSVEFMVCDDRQCLAPSEVEFKIPVGG